MPVMVECQNKDRCGVQRHQQNSPADRACGAASKTHLIQDRPTHTPMVTVAQPDSGTTFGIFIDSRHLGPSALHAGQHLHAITLEHESGRSTEVVLELASSKTPTAKEALNALVSRYESHDALEIEDWEYVVDADVSADLIAADYELAGQANTQLDDLLGSDREQVLAQLRAEALAAREEKKVPAWQVLKDQLSAAHPDIEISLGSSGPYTVLSKISVPTHLRGQGKAQAAMADLIDAADVAGTPLALTPSDAFGASKKRLEAFYGSYGFVPNKGRNKDYLTQETMIRQPR